MSRTAYIEKSQAAASALQTYIRSKRSDLAREMQGSNPNEGWGRSEAAELAHGVAQTNCLFSDEHFLHCTIPDVYGSPNEFKERLLQFQDLLSESIQELTAAAQEPDHVPMTVGMVLETTRALKHAIDNALDSLADAEAELPAPIRVATTSPPPVAAAVSTSPLDEVQRIADKFPTVLRSLSKRRAPSEPLTIRNEYDVQYLFEGLLTVSFDDVRPEETGPSVAGGSGRADTFLKDEHTVVEYKCTRPGLGAVELRKQIADDFLIYGHNAEIDRLFVFVYDNAGLVANRAGFERDLSQAVAGLNEVRVVVRS